MSSPFAIRIIYGFPVPQYNLSDRPAAKAWRAERLGRNGSGHLGCLPSWLSSNFPLLREYVAGWTGDDYGGFSADHYFVGMKEPLASVDEMKDPPFVRIKRELAEPAMVRDWQEALCACTDRLGCDWQTIGFYLLGEER